MQPLPDWLNHRQAERVYGSFFMSWARSQLSPDETLLDATVAFGDTAMKRIGRKYAEGTFGLTSHRIVFISIRDFHADAIGLRDIKNVHFEGRRNIKFSISRFSSPETYEVTIKRDKAQRIVPVLEDAMKRAQAQQG